MKAMRLFFQMLCEYQQRKYELKSMLAQLKAEPPMLFSKLLCKHKWVSHSKKEKSEKTFVRNIIGDSFNPTDIVREYIIEVLICEKCGKIKIIKY